MKWDVFRFLAVIRGGHSELISRNGHPFSSFTQLREAMKLSHPGQHLRREKLTDRKHELRRLLSRDLKFPVHYADHVEGHGTALFERVCRLDLEGIVAKHAFGTYTTEERTTWFKIKNRNYSQSQGREKLFERDRHKEPVPGWHSCDLACAEVNNELSD